MLMVAAHLACAFSQRGPLFASTPEPPACKDLRAVADGLDEDGVPGVDEDEMLAAATILRASGCEKFVAAAKDISARFEEFDYDSSKSLDANEITALLSDIPNEDESELLACTKRALLAVCGPSAAARRKLQVRITKITEEVAVLAKAQVCTAAAAPPMPMLPRLFL